MPVSDEVLNAHLERFGEALATRDVAASAALWALPGILIRDDLSAAFTSKNDVAEGEAPAFPIYDQIGLHHVRFTLLERVDLSSTLLRVRVRWHFLNADDEPLTDIEFEYILQDTRDGLGTRATIAIDVVERVNELLE